MVHSNGSRGKGKMTRTDSDCPWVITWEDGSEQGFKNLGDAFYALGHNGDDSPTLAQALEVTNMARPELLVWDTPRRNPITGHFTGGDRGQR